MARYGDNGSARSRDEPRAYFAAYRRRAPLDLPRHRLSLRAMRAAELPTTLVRSYLPRDTRAYRLAKRAY